jgi:hypothetical protein
MFTRFGRYLGMNNKHSSLELIAEQVRTVASDLAKGLPESEKINVWFTGMSIANDDPNSNSNFGFQGHSLGCATASIAYSKALCIDHELGDLVVVRDAYLFAAPITCDVQSSKGRPLRAFQQKEWDLRMTSLRQED